jgi:hypothetical protein
MENPVSPRDRFCKSDACGAPIVFALMPNGHAHPLDPGENAEGTVATWFEGGVLRGRYVTQAEPAYRDEVLMVSHFATCPAAGEHRRSGSKGGGPAGARSMSATQRTSSRAQHAPRH